MYGKFTFIQILSQLEPKNIKYTRRDHLCFKDMHY